jgi:hypothetical protein
MDNLLKAKRCLAGIMKVVAFLIEVVSLFKSAKRTYRSWRSGPSAAVFR